MTLAAADLWAYKRALVVVLLLLAVAGALANLGFSSGLLSDPRSVGNIFQHPFGRPAFGPAPTPASAQISAPTESCHSPEPPSPDNP